MNKYALFSLAIASLFISCNKDNQTDPFDETVISMGTDYTSDVYFSFAQGVVNSVSRNTWDLAFSTPVQTAAIRINEGAGAELYCVADTTAWSTFTSFNQVDYDELLNSNSDWLLGAFNVNHDPADMFNYGWGTYTGPPNHNVEGDSLYVIRLTDGSYKKLMIKQKVGATDVYVLRWANVDGSEQVDTSFSAAPYAGTKHFIHYSLTSSEVVEAEPDMSEWDLLFTRYNDIIQAGPTTMKYTFTGVLSNPDVMAAEVTDVPPVSATPANAAGGFMSDADVIGYDWKVSDPVTHEISLVDSLSYFVQSVDGNTYQLYVSGYGGMNQGTISIRTRLVE